METYSAPECDLNAVTQLRRIGRYMGVLDQDSVAAHLRKACETLKRAAEDPDFRNAIVGIAETITHALRDGGKILFAGNCDSAGDAQHIAGEFLSRLNFDRNDRSHHRYVRTHCDRQRLWIRQGIRTSGTRRRPTGRRLYCDFDVGALCQRDRRWGIHANATEPARFRYDNLAIAANIIHGAAKLRVEADVSRGGVRLSAIGSATDVGRFPSRRAARAHQRILYHRQDRRHQALPSIPQAAWLRFHFGCARRIFTVPAIGSIGRQDMWCPACCGELTKPRPLAHRS